MPEGQFSGSKSRYVYETETVDEKFILTLDDSLVTPGQALQPFDPAVPPTGNVCPAPKRFKPRIVYWQATGAGFEGKRKQLVCGTNVATLYATQTPAALTIDGVEGITTGRRGEVQSF